MALTAPEAKKPEERRRTEKPARGEWVDLQPLTEPILPELPAIDPDGEPWCEMAQRAWKAWRADPASQEFGESDFDYAFQTVCLFKRFVSHASEIRLRMDAMGLTPKGRRDLRLRLPQETKTVEDTERRRDQRKTRTKRRAKLSVVD